MIGEPSIGQSLQNGRISLTFCFMERKICIREIEERDLADYRRLMGLIN